MTQVSIGLAAMSLSCTLLQADGIGCEMGAMNCDEFPGEAIRRGPYRDHTA